MSSYHVIEERKIVNDDVVDVFTVVDEDGYPINNGHFTDADDAEYVRAEMETDNYRGDIVSELCKGVSSWVCV